MELSPKQIAWIKQKYQCFMQKWLDTLPQTEEEWEMLVNEFHDLYAKSRNNELMKCLLVEGVSFIDKITVINKRLCG